MPESITTIIFILIAVAILVPALLAVTARDLVRGALWLIAAFFGVGALFLLLDAEFLAIAQVLIYVGATSVLILFAIMLTRRDPGVSDRPWHTRWWLALLGAAGLFGLILLPTLRGATWPQPPQGQGLAGALELGTSFMREYLLPFTAVSLLLLVALVGAIMVALDGGGGRRILTLAQQVAARNKERETATTKKRRTEDHEVEEI